MRRWQFDILWGIAAAGVVFLPFAKALGLDLDPATMPTFGALLAYVLTQRGEWTKKGPKDSDAPASTDEDDS